jgi:hypothetical protein
VVVERVVLSGKTGIKSKGYAEVHRSRRFIPVFVCTSDFRCVYGIVTREALFMGFLPGCGGAGDIADMNHGFAAVQAGNHEIDVIMASVNKCIKTPGGNGVP